MRLESITLALLPALTVADFHINQVYTSVFTGSGTNNWFDYSACPSNYWNCKCIGFGDRTGNIDGDPIWDNSFSISKGFCGMGKLNFYKKNDGFEMYEDGGNGKVIGTCYKNDGDSGKYCAIPIGSSVVTEGWVCYSYVCNR